MTEQLRAAVVSDLKPCPTVPRTGIAWRSSTKLYAHPPIPRVDPDWLANVIRTVDGNHTMGAGTLAEKIAEAINGRAK